MRHQRTGAASISLISASLATWRCRLCVVWVLGLLPGMAGCQSFGNKSDEPPVKPRRTVRSSPLSAGAGPELVDELNIAGEIITADDIVSSLRQRRSASAMTTPPGLPAGSASYAVVVDAVQYAIDEALLFREAERDLAEAEVEWVDKYTDQILRDIVQKEHGGRQAAYEQFLVSRGTTLDESREKTRRELIIQRYLSQRVFSRVGDPTRVELVHYFDRYKKESAADERRELLLIEVPIEHPDDDKSSPRLPQPYEDAVRAARNRIESALSELRAGTPFANVAASYSQGLHADEGGSWGLVTREGLRPRWLPAVQALFNLPEGGTSEIIAGEDAFFIVRCGRVDRAAEPDFKAMQPELRERYRKAQQAILLDELIVKLRQRGHIDPERVKLFVESVVDSPP